MFGFFKNKVVVPIGRKDKIFKWIIRAISWSLLLLALLFAISLRNCPEDELLKVGFSGSFLAFVGIWLGGIWDIRERIIYKRYIKELQSKIK